jgi:hypothetical protein
MQCRLQRWGARVWVGPVQITSTVHLYSILYQLKKYCTFIQYHIPPFQRISKNHHSPRTPSIALCWTFQKDNLGHGVVLSFNIDQFRALQMVVDKLSTGCFSVDKWCFQVCQVFYLVRLILTLSEIYSNRVRLFMAWMVQRKIITKIFWTFKKQLPKVGLIKWRVTAPI